MEVFSAKSHSAITIMGKKPVNGHAVDGLNWHVVWFKGEADSFRSNIYDPPFIERNRTGRVRVEKQSFWKHQWNGGVFGKYKRR